jgi:hypothetical protein
MPRELSPAALAQSLAGQLAPAFFVRIQFLVDTVYLWSGLGSISAPGPAYDPLASFPYGTAFIGIGWLGQIRAIPEVSDIVASNITLELSGIPVELVTDAINQVRENGVATVWLGFMSTQPGNPTIIGDPVQVFQGALDVPTITESSATCTIAITCENPLIDLNRAPNRRFTDVDQQLDYPGDTGFFQVQLLQDMDLIWPYPRGSTDSVPPPNYLTITPGQTAPVAIAVGGTAQLTCVETRSDGTTQVVMGPGEPGGNRGGAAYSSDVLIATVDGNGLVTGVAQGMCVITKPYVESMFLGGGSSRPSNRVTASVTIIVTE